MNDLEVCVWPISQPIPYAHARHKVAPNQKKPTSLCPDVFRKEDQAR
jgi:hypothetical protein